jgi:hypothetical protein
MAGTIEQIAQRLSALDQQVEALGKKFYDAYHGYLTSLGQVVRKQIILSCYHACTEGYPQRFLVLPVSRRQELQEDLRDLAKQAEIELLENLRSIEETTAEFNAVEDVDDLEEIEELLGDTTSDINDSRPVLTPLEILHEWQEQIDRSILKTLKSTSTAANRLLQNAEILPKQLLQPVLDAVAKAEGNEPSPSTPNLLSLLVDASEKGSDSAKSIDGSALMHVVVVNLRLAEIEFNDATVMSWRNKLRELKKQLQTIETEYQKRLKEKAIAEAQLAWKSTWIND